jgi:hypothetical protein
MPAFFSIPVQVPLREKRLLHDGAGTGDPAQFMKNVVWKGERLESPGQIPFRSLCQSSRGAASGEAFQRAPTR